MGPLAVNIIANCRCTHVLLHSKKAKRNWINRLCVIIFIIGSRGGVKDTRLEAKAKDPKKSEAKAKAKDSLSEERPSRGQGQECSRPRTKDTGASVLQKKRSSKIFFRRSPIHWRTQDFDWGRPKPQITWNDVIKIFPKRKFLWDKDIAEWKIWNRCLFARNQDFAKGEGLN